MKAVVMAGGEGSRLRPLTLERPKPMVTLGHAPAMQHTLNLLRRHGITEIVVTLHYLGSAIEDYFQSGEDFGLQITYTHEDRPLGTAGSVGLARDILDEPFLVVSGDALTDVDLSAFMEFHRERQAAASLLLYHVPNPLEYGVVITDDAGRIQRFQEKPSWGEVLSDTVNTGIYALDPSVFEIIPAGRSVDFSLDVFPAMLRRGQPLYGYVARGYWTDVGTLDAYRDANADLVTGKVDVGAPPVFRAGQPAIDATATIDPSARVLGSVYVGRGCDIRAGALLSGPAVIGDYSVVDERAEIRESVVLSNVVIGAEARLDRCIVGRQCYLGRGVMIGQAAVVGDGTTLAAEASVRAGVRIWPHKYVDAGVVVDRSLIHGRHARRTIFSHGGVAGLANAELTPEFAARLGAAWGSTLPLNASIVANRDNARPARMFKRALMAGLASVGVRVIDIGATPFPVARFATRLYRTVGGIHVRMSPYEPASIEVRFLDPQGVDVRKSDERAIETLFTREDFRRVGSAAIAEITLAQPLEAYAEALLASVPGGAGSATPLGVVVDYMGGSCGEVLPGLLAQLGVRETAIDASPADGGPNYQDVDARLARLGRIVTAVEAAFGALLDADGNRVWIVDERGRLLEELETIALMLRILHNAGRQGAVAFPFTVPNSVARLAHDLGFEPLRTKADVAEAMRAAHQHGAVLAANARRAFAFPPLHAGPDAMAAVVQVVQCLCAGDLSVSGLISRLPPFCVVHAELPVSWDDRGAVMRALNEHAERVDEGDLDGVVFGRGDQRAVVLPDVDRPVFQIIAEGATPEAAQTLADRIGDLVSRAAS